MSLFPSHFQMLLFPSAEEKTQEEDGGVEKFSSVRIKLLFLYKMEPDKAVRTLCLLFYMFRSE